MVRGDAVKVVDANVDVLEIMVRRDAVRVESR
jgi:hypothetical protein